MLRKLRDLFLSKSGRPYKLFQLESSLMCNLDCVMCPWTDLHPQGAVMSWDTFSRIAENFHLTRSADLTGGGEPTLNPRLFDMVGVAKEANCEVGFSTNGALIDSEAAKTLLALEQDWISFSLDGATAATYNHIRRGADFETITDNIKALHRLKTAQGSQTPMMMLVFVMMRENYHELPLYIDLAHNLGIEHVIIKNLDVILKEEDNDRRLFSHTGKVDRVEIESLLVEAQQRAQQVGLGLRLYALQPQELPICEQNPLRSLFFNWAGDVSPCITLSYAAERIFNSQRHLVSCQHFGNINRESLEQIWNKATYQEFRQPYQERVRQEQQARLDLLSGRMESEGMELPPAPEGCRTCYYLYGV
jgi:MoaA/NifB/PqqE/SkfB family radical SAM enzyme